MSTAPKRFRHDEELRGNITSGLPLLKSGSLIELEGIICAGKSTAMASLRHTSTTNDKGLPVHYYDEDVKAEWIDEYKTRLAAITGNDSAARTAKGQWAMMLQNRIMEARETTIRDAIKYTMLGHTAVIERGSVGNLVFAILVCHTFGLPTTDLGKHLMRLVGKMNARKTMSPPKTAMVYFKILPQEAHNRNKIRDCKNPYDLSYLEELAGIYDTIVETTENSITVNASDVTTVVEENGKRLLNKESLVRLINQINNICDNSFISNETEDNSQPQESLSPVSCKNPEKEPGTPPALNSISPISPPLSMSPVSEKR